MAKSHNTAASLERRRCPRSDKQTHRISSPESRPAAETYLDPRKSCVSPSSGKARESAKTEIKLHPESLSSSEPRAPRVIAEAFKYGSELPICPQLGNPLFIRCRSVDGSR